MYNKSEQELDEICYRIFFFWAITYEFIMSALTWLVLLLLYATYVLVQQGNWKMQMQFRQWNVNHEEIHNINSTVTVFTKVHAYFMSRHNYFRFPTANKNRIQLLIWFFFILFYTIHIFYFLIVVSILILIIYSLWMAK